MRAESKHAPWISALPGLPARRSRQMAPAHLIDAGMLSSITPLAIAFLIAGKCLPRTTPRPLLAGLRPSNR